MLAYVSLFLIALGAGALGGLVGRTPPSASGNR